MSKLGYTFYPKDWASSESVFELELHERGLYRELMDLAYLNDNKTEIKKDTWVRKFSCTIELLDAVLNRLFHLKLIEYKDDLIFIPSCESRLNLSRGGKKSKPTETAKNNLKNVPKIDKKEPMSEPMSEQIEKKENIIEKKENIIEILETKNFQNSISINEIFGKEILESQTWIETISMQNKIKPPEVKTWIETFNKKLLTELDNKISKKEYASHFSRWLPTEIQKLNKHGPGIAPPVARTKNDYF
jgi:hypothetical protein